MTPVIPCSSGCVTLLTKVTFSQRRDIKLAKCNVSRRSSKPSLSNQRLLLPQSVSLRLLRKHFYGCHPRQASRAQLLEAVGADIATEAQNPSVSDEEADASAEISSAPAETDEASAVSASVLPATQSRRSRPARKSDMPPVNNEELVPGASFTGKVRSIQPFGAFVDFGAFTDGLVHVSKLSDEFVKDVANVVSVGQEVKVRIVDANMETGRISLTMRDSDDSSRLQQRKDPSSGGDREKPRTDRRNNARSQRRNEPQKASKFTKGQVLDGTVKNLTRAGAYISLPDGEEGFLPMSEESEGFGNILGNSSLQAGQEVNVRVLRISRGQVTLTMKKEEDVAAINMKLNHGVVHTASNPFMLAFRKNKDIAAFLDEREKAQESARASEQLEEKVDESVQNESDKLEVPDSVTSCPTDPASVNQPEEGSVQAPISSVVVADEDVADTLSSEENVPSTDSTVPKASTVTEENVPSTDSTVPEASMVIEESVLSTTSTEPEASTVIEEVKETEMPEVTEDATSETNAETESDSSIQEAEKSTEALISEEDELVTDSKTDEPVTVNDSGETISGAKPNGEVDEALLPLSGVDLEVAVESQVKNNLVDENVESPVHPEEEVADTTPADVISATDEPLIINDSGEIISGDMPNGVVGEAVLPPDGIDPEEAVENQVENNLVDEKVKVPVLPEEQIADNTPADAISAIGEALTVNDSDENSSEAEPNGVVDEAVLPSEGVDSEVAVENQVENNLVDEKVEVPVLPKEEIADTTSTDAIFTKTSQTQEINDAVSNGQSTPAQENSAKGSISPALVKQLREESGAGMMDCKKALAETGGDIVKAQEFLRKKGLASADKKASRATAEGRIGSYIHDNRIGVLIEVNCETDFVSRGDIFKELVDDLAMQVAACPQVQYLVTEDVPEETVNKEREIEMQKEDLLTKPEQIREKIIEGRIRKRLEEFALLEQPYIKNDKVVVKDWVKQTIATIGENIKVKRFIRYNLGEGLQKRSQDFAAEVAAQTAVKEAPTVPKEQPTETEEIVEKPPSVAISAAKVKQLREETGAGMMDCKKALTETGGNLEEAQEYLRKKGLSSADKKSSRLAAEGRIATYIHDSRIGVLIEVNCETDFVARNEKFKELVDDLAMQVAACPQVQFVSMEEISSSVLINEKEIEMQREDLKSKPENIREKIVEGRVSKRLGELALLEQPFIKDDSVLVKDLVKQTVATLGENIKVRRFARFNLGE